MEHTHKEQRVLPYTPSQLYKLVMDIESYPRFLPWCIDAKIFQDDPVKKELAARVTVGYKIFRERFASLVAYDEKEKTICVTYLSGPLTALENRWKFLPDPSSGGCLIDFHVGFSFSSIGLSKLFSVFFDKAIRKMVTAFEAEAAQRYTPVS